MKYPHLFILTCKRDTPNPYLYLEATVAQIEAQIAQGLYVGSYRCIVSDGLYEGPKFPGWDIKSYLGKTSPGNRDAWFEIIGMAASLGGDCIALEDDIELCPGGLERMLDFQIPGDLSFIQFFASKANYPAKTPNGLKRAPGGAPFAFLQAMKFSHSGIMALDAFRKSPNFLLNDEADRVITQACRDNQLSFGTHVPSLVQHVGEVSKAYKMDKLAWWRKSDSFQVSLDVKALDASKYQ